MNDEKRIENKKVDRKALMILIPILIVSFFAGIFLSALGAMMEENIADVISKGIVTGLTVITPYANLVMYTICILISIIVLANVKKKMKVWDGEDEETYEKIDQSMSRILIIANLAFILSYFFFAAGFEYCIKTATAVEMICYFGGFILSLAGNIIIQQKVVNIYKELNPEKQGSVYAMDFAKQWEKSCDEAEKMQIYKAAFGAYNVSGTVFMVLWLFCILGNQIWHFGIMPATIVTVMWLVQFISYQAYAAYYSKNPNKV